MVNQLFVNIDSSKSSHENITNANNGYILFYEITAVDAKQII